MIRKFIPDGLSLWRCLGVGAMYSLTGAVPRGTGCPRGMENNVDDVIQNAMMLWTYAIANHTKPSGLDGRTFNWCANHAADVLTRHRASPNLKVNLRRLRDILEPSMNFVLRPLEKRKHIQKLRCFSARAAITVCLNNIQIHPSTSAHRIHIFVDDSRTLEFHLQLGQKNLCV